MDRLRGFQHRVRALPGLLAEAPTWTVLLAGVTTTLLGILIVSRPLTSLVLLGVYIGVSAIISGVADLLSRRSAARWNTTVLGLVWIVAGVAILVWLGRSIELLPVFVAGLLIVSGCIHLAGLFRKDVEASERAFKASFGIAEIGFGLFALTWLDLTLIVVAVLFGIRTIVFGVSLLWRGGRALLHKPEVSRKRHSVLRWISAVVVLMLAVGALWLSHTLRSGIPVVDSFYATPAIIPTDPGTLIRYEPYTGLLPDRLSAWRILYSTTGKDGRPALASGVVAVPDSVPPGPRPVIAWAHGTLGIAQSCAPSLRPNAIYSEVQEYGIPALEAAIENGWVIVATDYTGMGAAGDFPYLIGEGQARSVLDGIRAVHGLPFVTVSNEAIVWGHSQGGHAALWTAQLAPDYAPEISILGTAALSPASNVFNLARYITSGGTSGPVAIAISYLTVAYSGYYEDIHLSDYVAMPARRLVREMAARCTSGPGLLVSVLGSLAVTHDRPIFDIDLTTGPIVARLEENIPHGPFPQPLLIAYGQEDEVIPASIQQDYVEMLCASGQPLEHQPYPGKDHMSVLAEESTLPADLAQWTSARLERLPIQDWCSR